MFDVFGDEITFEGRTVARLVSSITLGARRDVEDAFRMGPEGYVSDEEHEKAIADAEEDAFTRGKEDGEEEGRRKAEEEHERELGEAKAAAFDEGLAEAARVAGRLDDVARIGALLKTLEDAERVLRSALNGVEEKTEHGFTKRRPVKLSELKQVARTASFALARAHAEFTRG